ncbi:hypothetical protein [Vibrio sp. 10N.239.312.D08]|uniref:hypothetical protein n=1 Tax=Vibrio sp. 10N.239.312.D08 TaxID=3229978 RepID=UPI003550B75D
MNHPDTICGYPFITIRTFLRLYAHGEYHLQCSEFFENSGLSITECRELAMDLYRNGYLDVRHNRHKNIDTNDWLYGLEATPSGRALAMKSMTKRMGRKAITKLAKTVMARASEVNEWPCFIYTIERIYVFGSYLDNNAVDFGDIDLIIQWGDKTEFLGSECVMAKSGGIATNDVINVFGQDYDSLHKNISLRSDKLYELKERGKISYRIPKGGMYDWLAWDIKAVQHHVKRNNHRISIHSMPEFKELTTDKALLIFDKAHGGVLEKPVPYTNET